MNLLDSGTHKIIIKHQQFGSYVTASRNLMRTSLNEKGNFSVHITQKSRGTVGFRKFLFQKLKGYWDFILTYHQDRPTIKTDPWNVPEMMSSLCPSLTFHHLRAPGKEGTLSTVSGKSYVESCTWSSLGHVSIPEWTTKVREVHS